MSRGRLGGSATFCVFGTLFNIDRVGGRRNRKANTSTGLSARCLKGVSMGVVLLVWFAWVVGVEKRRGCGGLWGWRGGEMS